MSGILLEKLEDCYQENCLVFATNSRRKRNIHDIIKYTFQYRQIPLG